MEPPPYLSFLNVTKIKTELCSALRFVPTWSAVHGLEGFYDSRHCPLQVND